MSNTIPQFAPGCFGSALAFDENAPVCSVCTFKDQCGPVHELNLIALREKLGIRVKKRAPNRKEEPSAHPSPAMMLAKKTQALVERIERSKIRVTEGFREGRNPFDNAGMQFMRIASHLLLKLKQPMSREVLAMALETKLNWSKGTADSHARMAMQALAYIGAVDVIDGAVTLRR
jgi:hypothetical protein